MQVSKGTGIIHHKVEVDTTVLWFALIRFGDEKWEAGPFADTKDGLLEQIKVLKDRYYNSVDMVRIYSATGLPLGDEDMIQQG